VEPKNLESVVSRLGEFADAAHDPAASGHLRTLQGALDAIARGDLGSVLDGAVEDVTLDIYAPPEFPFVRTARGADAFRAALKHNFGAVHDQRPEVRDLFADGDRIVLLGRETGVIRQSGLTYDVEFVERFTFRDARLASVQIIAAYSKPSGD
jgi:ketosteroid isomerase-like protein